MKQYLNLMRDIYVNGYDHIDRTGVGRRTVVGPQMRFNLQEGLPVVTSRKIFLEGVIKELIWFTRGGYNVKDLNRVGVRLWDRWGVQEKHIDAFIAKYLSHETPESLVSIKKEIMEHEEGSLGPIYGPTWRSVPTLVENTIPLWPTLTLEDIASDRHESIQQQTLYAAITLKDNPVFQSLTPEEQRTKLISLIAYREVDQLQNLLNTLRDFPFSSRHVISSWIPGLIPFEQLSPQENVLLGKMALAPCHVLQQYLVREKDGVKHLSLVVYVRSNDVPVGAPYNIAQYAILLSLIAQVSGMVPYELVYNIGDAHIYLDQLPLIEEQLSREPLGHSTLWINPDLTDLFKIQPEDIRIDNYHCLPHIPYPVAE